jgi:hypothetical protein
MEFLARSEVQQTPIGKLIRRELLKQGRKPSELVLQLGYRNVSKGLRRLELAMIEGEIRPMIKERLAEGLGIGDARVQKVIERTEHLVDEQRRRQVRKERLERRRLQKEHFRPHLLALTEHSRPQVGQIVIASLVWGNIETARKLAVSMEVVRSRGKRRAHLSRELIRAHFAEQEDRVPILGRIEGYALVSRFAVEPTWFFDVEGNRVVARPTGEVPGEGRSIVSHKGKTLIQREWTP